MILRLREPRFALGLIEERDKIAATLSRILDRIDDGLRNGSRYSNAPNATDRAAWRVVADLLPEKSEKQAREIVATWVNG